MRFLASVFISAVLAFSGHAQRMPQTCGPELPVCPANQACMSGFCIPSGSVPSTCESNGDCKVDETCLGGMCVPSSAVPSTCESNGDCKAGQVCISNYCLPDTTTSSSSFPPMPSLCEVEADCAEGDVCFWGVCAPASSVPKTCAAASDCKQGDLCLMGMCINTGGTDLPFPTCTNTASCPTGNSCLFGYCLPNNMFPGGNVPSTCQVQPDCPNETDLCMMGFCIPTGMPDPSCSTPCARGEQCVMGMCWPKDTSCEEGCDQGEVCVAGVCINADQPVFGCDEYCDWDSFCDPRSRSCVPIFGEQCDKSCVDGTNCVMGQCLPCPLCGSVDEDFFKTFGGAGFNISDFENSISPDDIRNFGPRLSFGEGMVGMFPPQNLDFDELRFNMSAWSKPTTAVLPPDVVVQINQLFSANPLASLALNPAAVLKVLDNLLLKNDMTFLLNGNQSFPAIFDFSAASNIVINGTLDLIGRGLNGARVIFPDSPDRIQTNSAATIRVAGGITLEGVLSGTPLFIEGLTGYSRPEVSIDTQFEIFSPVLSPIQNQQARMLINGTLKARHPTLDADLIVGTGGIVEILSEEKALLGSLELGTNAQFILHARGENTQMDKFIGCDESSKMRATLFGYSTSVNFSAPDAPYIDRPLFSYTSYVSGKALCEIELVILDGLGNIVQTLEVLNPLRPVQPTTGPIVKSARKFGALSKFSLAASSSADCKAVWDQNQLRYTCGVAPSGSNSAPTLGISIPAFFMTIFSVIFGLFF